MKTTPAISLIANSCSSTSLLDDRSMFSSDQLTKESSPLPSACKFTSQVSLQVAPRGNGESYSQFFRLKEWLIPELPHQFLPLGRSLIKWHPAPYWREDGQNPGDNIDETRNRHRTPRKCVHHILGEIDIVQIRLLVGSVGHGVQYTSYEARGKSISAG